MASSSHRWTVTSLVITTIITTNNNINTTTTINLTHTHIIIALFTITITTTIIIACHKFHFYNTIIIVTMLIILVRKIVLLARHQIAIIGIFKIVSAWVRWVSSMARRLLYLKLHKKKLRMKQKTYLKIMARPLSAI